MADTKIDLPAGWCGAEAPNATGGSPHHCNMSAGHDAADLDQTVHECPCSGWWTVASEAVDGRPAGCMAEHETAGACVLVAGHATRHCAAAGDDRLVWWSA